MTGLQVQVQVLPGPWRTGKKGEALERLPVGGTALCDVVVRRGLCGRDGEGERESLVARLAAPNGGRG